MLTLEPTAARYFPLPSEVTAVHWIELKACRVVVCTDTVDDDDDVSPPLMICIAINE